LHEPALSPLLFSGQAWTVLKAPAPRERVLPWAALLKRTWGTDVLACGCGGRRQIVAFVEDPKRVKEILEQLGLPCAEPVIAQARAPPQQELFEPAPAFAAHPTWPDA